MIMMGLWFTDRIPFSAVYLHGLVRDKYGRKLSKTTGNVIDPLELIDQFGADPLRFTLVTSSTPGNDINLDTDKVEANWRFVNKIWQMTNFVLGNLDGKLPTGAPPAKELDLPSRWIMSRLTHLTGSVQYLFDTYQYGEAGRQIYEFLWSEFADWYIEISKYPLYEGSAAAKQTTQRVLMHVMNICLRLLHPYMPFVTEELWTYISQEDAPLILAKWPNANETYLDDRAEAEMNVLMELVRGIRNVRTEYNVDPAHKIAAAVAPGSYRKLLERYGYIFARLCNVSKTTLLADVAAAPDESASVVVSEVTVYLPLAGMVDVQAECDRLTKEQIKLQEQIVRSKNMLSNEQFTSRAKPEVVERERAKLADLEASVNQITERLASLCKEN
jgi:valyl-tRNA synthetase